MKEVHNIFPIMVDAPANLKTVNFYIVKTEQSLSLVDAGFNNKESYKALELTLQENGFSTGDLTEIILTHNHYDHVGLVNPITRKHPIPVYAHKDAIPRLKRDPRFLEMRVDFYAKLYEEMGCGDAGDKQISFLKKSIERNSNQQVESEIIPIGAKHLHFDVIEVPGHAPDQIALHSLENKEMIAGDLMIEHISSNALVEPDFNGKKLPTLLQHKQSLEKVQKLDIERIYSGHGNIIQNPSSLIRKRIDGIELKAEKIRKVIEEGTTTGDEIARKFYKKSYHSQFSLVMSEIIGHLDYLEISGRVSKEMKNGIWHYYIEK
ncbi:MBL fold metallo-hydrolase [Oceanobacillus caeni]|uniref:Metallo-beta-lactamasee n=1 Tax=Oceanobacillus caeni TaxID=405946 RepID=A0ABR5MG09_9BACI|nr:MULTISPECIES: MBL fold metallo-hydrolase [Bacillaceae]KKE78680.1 metallo-beta-lactamasee [Bacilli bacterium VT-13-104]PZD83740.1 MBL fold hydrolase [Bacilli bacterium]KPH71321.1 metallo-beta-lactamasee [Oceanobacillus caeni]MBU8791994.1 MBL fold metallo-hydrolase [Oceanobacillus caeni]MCR1835872.1 MBL fold metallo-hydrolase [Oceanobacillus caeni]